MNERLTIPACSVLLLTASLPAERNAPELTGVVGSTKDILSIMFPCRYDAHMVEWRWHLYLARFPK